MRQGCSILTLLLVFGLVRPTFGTSHTFTQAKEEKGTTATNSLEKASLIRLFFNRRQIALDEIDAALKLMRATYSNAPPAWRSDHRHDGDALVIAKHFLENRGIDPEKSKEAFRRQPLFLALTDFDRWLEQNKDKDQNVWRTDVNRLLIQLDSFWLSARYLQHLTTIDQAKNRGGNHLGDNFRILAHARLANDYKQRLKQFAMSEKDFRDLLPPENGNDLAQFGWVNREHISRAHQSFLEIAGRERFRVPILGLDAELATYPTLVGLRAWGLVFMSLGPDERISTQQRPLMGPPRPQRE